MIWYTPSPTIATGMGSKCAAWIAMRSSTASGIPIFTLNRKVTSDSPGITPSTGSTDAMDALVSPERLTLNGNFTLPSLRSASWRSTTRSNGWRPTSITVLSSEYLIACASAVSSTSYAGPPSTSHTATTALLECARAKYEISTVSSSPGSRYPRIGSTSKTCSGSAVFSGVPGPLPGPSLLRRLRERLEACETLDAKESSTSSSVSSSYTSKTHSYRAGTCPEFRMVMCSRFVVSLRTDPKLTATADTSRFGNRISAPISTAST